WLKGTQIESETRGFKVQMDKPLEENGTNLAPKPAEVSLQSLGSCLLFAYLYAANKLKVTIEGLKVELEGEVVSGGWQDEQKNKRNGFRNVQFKVQVITEHSNEEIQKVHNLALKASPMYDNFIHPIAVTGSFLIQ
ncbi:MAG: OsmC family protein, partial [Candidatus Atribacteria bacterium]|nr:OsmC family protein [Candidatus Atribacteria bacterium]